MAAEPAASSWILPAGNRDDAARKSEGSVLQALALMNDPFIVNRIHAQGTGAAANFSSTDEYISDSQLVNQLYLRILSRCPPRPKLKRLSPPVKGGAGQAE